MKVDKVVVTNLTALSRKYDDQIQPIRDAINSLIAADQVRGLQTQLVGVDDSTTMNQFSSEPVSNYSDPAQNKRAIDGVYTACAPDYILILGSADIVPHQDLINPLAGDTDPDPIAFGDLPYACDAPYSQQPQDFIGPTRVVGRIPDITGGQNPDYLVNLLKRAANYTSSDLSQLQSLFAVGAQIWQDSTTLSAKNVIGSSADVQFVPPDGSNWDVNSLRRRLHFFNCHGASDSPDFYGQPADGSSSFPVALDAGYLDGKLSPGNIVAAECCYGAQLYDPGTNHIPTCNTYLANGAFAFFGSTTIAYGPAEGNGQADLICQYFLEGVLAGASLGRAALEARQKFIRSLPTPGPSDIKMLAQYNLYGDPSLTPVKSETKAETPLGVAVPSYTARTERAERRRALFSEGIHLSENRPLPHRLRDPLRGAVVRALTDKARELSMEPGEVLSFLVRRPQVKTTMPAVLFDAQTTPTAFHILFRKVPEPRDVRVVNIVALVAKEINGQIVSITKLFSR